MGKVSDSKKHTLTKGQQHTGEVIVGGQRLDYTIDAKPISTTPSKMASNEWKTIKLHFVPKKSGTKIQFFGSHEVGCSLVRNIKITQCEKLLDGCQKNCQGYSCDYWSTEENYSCALLEKDYGCNCNGCICKVDTEACANDKCQGKSCDDWVQLGRWPCSYLKKQYSCGCKLCQCKEPEPLKSCVIITGVFSAKAVTNHGIELYTICDVEDISQYGLGTANNGKGSNGVEFKFSTVRLPLKLET